VLQLFTKRRRLTCVSVNKTKRRKLEGINQGPTAVVGIRMLETEKKAYARLAREAHLPISNYLLLVLRKFAKV